MSEAVVKLYRHGRLVAQTVNGVLMAAGGETWQRPVLTASVRSIPVSKWPVWAKTLKLAARPGDDGIGDVVLRLIGKENSASFKSWHKNIFGKDCKCPMRQAKWNKQYPLHWTSPPINKP